MKSVIKKCLLNKKISNCVRRKTVDDISAYFWETNQPTSTWYLLDNASRLKGLNSNNQKIFVGLNSDNPKVFVGLNSILPGLDRVGPNPTRITRVIFSRVESTNFPSIT